MMTPTVMRGRATPLKMKGPPLCFTLRRSILLAATLCLPLISGETPAADTTLGQVIRVKGQAVIVQDALYTLCQEGTPLKPGNRLLTLEGAEAVLQFTDQCQYRLGEDQLFDVGEQSPCALGQGGEYQPGVDLAHLPGSSPAALQPAAFGQDKATAASAAATSIGILEEAKGEVKINDKVVRSGVQLHRRNPIATGADSEARLKLSDGQILYLRPSSRFVINDYRYSSQTPANNRAALELTQGGLVYYAGAMAKENPQAVTLTTPSGTLQINAANFRVIIGSMIVQVSAGMVTIEGREVRAGQYLYVSNEGLISVFESLAELEAAIPTELLSQAATLNTTATLVGGQAATLVGGLTTASITAGIVGATLIGVTLGDINQENDPISVQP